MSLSPMLITLLAQAGQGAGQQAQQGVNHQTLMIWAISLMGLALTLMIVEIFLPTGGILGFLAACSAVAGIVLFFWFSMTAGLIALLASIVATPICIIYGLKMAPSTPFFRMLVLDHQEGITGPPESSSDDEVHVGSTGTALTDLRPVGACLVDGKKIDCLAVGPQIERDQPIEVIGRSSAQWRVRLAKSES